MNKINIAEMEIKYPKKVIFNGKSFGVYLKPCEIDGKFTKYAKFEKSLLKVNYPKGYGWGRVGVESNSTVLNFDNNSSNVSSTLTFKFDPEETTGFEVDLDGVNIKSQSFSKISIIYGQTDKNNSVLELHKDGSLQSKLDMGNKAPEFVKLVVSPNNFAYLELPDGRYLQTTSLQYPVPEKGYNLKVYAKAAKYKTFAKMALRSIDLRDIPFHEKEEEILFNGKYLFGKWEPYAKNGGNFIEHARFEKNEFIVDVPKGHGWGNVGLWSTKPIIDFMETNKSLSYHLKFNFDTKNTENFSIMIANLVHLDYKRKDDKTASIELWNTSFMYGGHMYGKLDLGSTIPKYVEIVMEPSNIMHIRLPDGRSMQTALSNYMTTGKHKIGIYSVAKEKNLPAKMALKSITLKKTPFSHSYLSNLKDNEKKIVLFAGNLGDIWLPYNRNGGNFSKYASFSKNELVVDVPKGNKWGETGIVSPKSVIWLDKLKENGEIKLRVNFNSNKTTGFSIFVGDINKFWKTPTSNFMQLNWGIDENNISKIKLKIKNKIIFDENLTQKVPSYILLRFQKEKISIESDTFNKRTIKWSYIVENRGLHLWVASHAFKYNQEVKMTLNKIIMERKFGDDIPASKPAKGVSPLSKKEIYGNKTRNQWECYKKNNDGNCTLNDSNLKIVISKGLNSTFGIKSKNKIISLDRRRINVTPLKMIVSFNSKKTNSFYILLNKYQVILEKIGSDSYLFKWGDNFSRIVDAKWLKNKWNGKVNIVMAKNWTRIELDGGVAIHVSDYVMGKIPITVLLAPLNKKMKYDVNLLLENITEEWLMPDGMTAIERWELIADEDFNPDEFLNELREGK
jgi:hypothetical protein